jgi:proteic killer suppression protein
MTIKSFKCKDTLALFLGQRVRRWLNIERPVLRKLEQLDWSAILDGFAFATGQSTGGTEGQSQGPTQHTYQ